MEINQIILKLPKKDYIHSKLDLKQNKFKRKHRSKGIYNNYKHVHFNP